jgi:four helix bundle protein
MGWQTHNEAKAMERDLFLRRTEKETAMRDFRNLQVWTKAHKLVLALYRVTAGFPRREIFGLTGQIRRGAASIAANIAEGCGRDTEADFRHFLHMAMGSASEVEYHLLLAHDLNLLTDPVYEELEEEVIGLKRMLGALIRRMKLEAES